MTGRRSKILRHCKTRWLLLLISWEWIELGISRYPRTSPGGHIWLLHHKTHSQWRHNSNSNDFLDNGENVRSQGLRGVGDYWQNKDDADVIIYWDAYNCTMAESIYGHVVLAISLTYIPIGGNDNWQSNLQYPTRIFSINRTLLFRPSFVISLMAPRSRLPWAIVVFIE